MKAVFPLLALFFSLSAIAAPESPKSAQISGPWVELRSAPLFEASVLPLAPTWGPTLPAGTVFHTEKVYGRWLYGHPEPLPKMQEKDFAKSGWVFSRMLLVPGDKDTLPASLNNETHAILFHSEKILGDRTKLLDFLESLTLSKGTLRAFQQQDEAPMAWHLPAFLPLAQAADEPAPMGLSGTDLSFLDQEFKVLQSKKQEVKKKLVAKKLNPPPPPALTDKVKAALLSRYVVQKKFVLPPLTHEELDGFIYMRAIALRSLQGCAKNIQDYWKNKRWNIFRIFRLKEESGHPWEEFSLPAGYFATTARAMDLAGNESELAFLLVRPLVRELRLKRKSFPLPKNPSLNDLESKSNDAWENWLSAQSTKESDNLDVADEIAVDLLATECISRAGYRPMGALSYMRKLSAKRDEPWAKWHFEHAIGWDYRVERLAANIEESLAKKAFPAGTASNPKRFSTASRYWNLLP